MKTGTITVGDWSRDGHNISEDFPISIPENLTKSLQVYFDAAVKSGVPDITKTCNSYDDNEISKDLFDQLVEMTGSDAEKLDCEVDEDEGKVWVYPDGYAQLWLATVNTGIVFLGETGVVEIIAKNYENIYNIGGYGLFSS